MTKTLLLILILLLAFFMAFLRSGYLRNLLEITSKHKKIYTRALLYQDGIQEKSQYATSVQT